MTRLQCPSVKCLSFARSFGVLLLCCARLRAIDPQQPINQMHHTSWAGKEGVVGEVLAIAQTKDGFIWLGTTGGLLRFDGSVFERYTPEIGSFPDPSWVSALLATTEGGLWVGNLSNGASFLNGGRVTNYGEADGLPSGRVRSFAQDSHGTIWAAIAGGLASFDGARWHWIRKDSNLPDLPSTQPSSVTVNGQGVWFSHSKKGVYLLPTGASAFEQVTSQPIAGYLPTFTAAKDRVLLWIPELLTLLQFPANRLEENLASHAIANSAGMFLIDRDGSGWMGTRGEGIWRIPIASDLHGSISRDNPTIQRFSESEGLTSSIVYCAMEDREGDIWVGTLGGLDRFRVRNATWTELQTVATQRMQLVAGSAGDVWASSPQGLWNVRSGKTVRNSPPGVQFSFKDPADHSIWLSSENRGNAFLWHWVNGNYFGLQPPVLDRRWYHPKNPLADVWVAMKSPVRALTRDGEGALWVSIRGQGVYHQENGAWRRTEILKGQPYITAFGAVADSEGRVWLAYPERGAIALWDHGAVRVFSPENGLNIGAITQIAYSEGQLWAGGESGLTFYRNGKFNPVNPAESPSFEMVTGIAGEAASGLWLITRAGVVHIPQPEVSSVIRDWHHKVRSETFDLISDLAEHPSDTSDTPAVMGADGILWFATPRGVIRIDPAHLHRNLVTPKVALRSIMANGKTFSVYTPAMLPPRTTDLEIDYSVLSFSIPEKVRSRYRLLGLDTEWQDEGNRAQARFHDLRPGRYQFQVIAENSDGVWNYAGSSLDLVVQSAFYETIWFKLLYPAAAAVLFYWIYRLWIHHVTARVKLRYSERLAERTRIARELHDTLLQSLAGVSLQLDGVAKRAASHPERFISGVDQVRRTVDDCFLEARAQVWKLRSTSFEGLGLTAILREFCERMRPVTDADCEFHLAGEPRTLAPELEEELLRIAQEAVHNASQHARANKILVALEYTRKALILTITDDGRGFDPQEGLQKPDHWGLRNMQERALQIRATYTLTSNLGRGTKIEVRAPVPA